MELVFVHGMTVGWIEDFSSKMVKIVKPSDMQDCKLTELVDFDGEWRLNELQKFRRTHKLQDGTY
jgi:hypothetical protein